MWVRPKGMLPASFVQARTMLGKRVLRNWTGQHVSMVCITELTRVVACVWDISFPTVLAVIVFFRRGRWPWAAVYLPVFTSPSPIGIAS